MWLQWRSGQGLVHMLTACQSCQHSPAPPGTPPKRLLQPIQLLVHFKVNCNVRFRIANLRWTMHCWWLHRLDCRSSAYTVMSAACCAASTNWSMTYESDHNLHLTQCQHMNFWILHICKLATHGMTQCMQLLPGAATGTAVVTDIK